MSSPHLWAQAHAYNIIGSDITHSLKAAETCFLLFLQWRIMCTGKLALSTAQFEQLSTVFEAPNVISFCLSKRINLRLASKRWYG
jgi:hypothetical protein